MDTVKVLHMEGCSTERVINGEELVLLLESSKGLEQLRFTSLFFLLPLSIPTRLIPEALRMRNITLQYDREHGLVYSLSIGEHENWKIHDQGADQSLNVEVHQCGSQLDQDWCLRELKMAEEAGIRVASLSLQKSFHTVADNDKSIILTSRHTIPVIRTLQKLDIWGTDIEPDMFIRILSYVRECPQMNELEFCWCKLPTAFDPGLIPSRLIQRGLRVYYDRGNGSVYCLNLEDGQWKILEQGADQSLSVSIETGGSQREQDWDLQELKMASEAGVKISLLRLYKSFKSMADDAQSIILTSGCTIPVLQTLKQLEVVKTNIDLDMFVRILSYIQKCPQITELQFTRRCVLPISISIDTIPNTLRTRTLKVLYDCGLKYQLSFDDGQWKIHDQHADQSLDVRIDESDSQLQQEWRLQELKMAAEAGFPVSCLQLMASFRRFDVTNSCIVLDSDFRLANLKTVEVLHMKGLWYILCEITRDELLGLLQTCEGLTELRFDSKSFLLPLSIPPETIPPTFQRRNFNILYDRGNGLVYRLSFDHGQWEIHDQRADKPLAVIIYQSDSQPQQEWYLQELKMAAEAGVMISYLGLYRSFNTVADNSQSIILTSGLTIPVLPTLQELRVESHNINQEMFIKILSYVKECPQMTKLIFWNSQLPDVVDPEQIPSQLKERGLRVFRRVMEGARPRDRQLDLESGRWKDETDSEWR